MLDMGKPVRIVDLAKKMIALAGLVPDEDIEIRMVGVRPGEKLFEELNRAGENLVPTSHSKIRIFKGRQEDMGELLPWISRLERLLRQRDAEAVTAHLSSLVPEYQPLADVTSLVAQRAARSPAAPATSAAYTA